MFQDELLRRNPALVEAAIALHQEAPIPANTYVIELDSVEANGPLVLEEARRPGMTTLAMTKQVGRNSGFCLAILPGGVRQPVAVDMQCAVACARAGVGIGNHGHLVQVPRRETAEAAFGSITGRFSPRARREKRPQRQPPQAGARS